MDHCCKRLFLKYVFVIEEEQRENAVSTKRVNNFLSDNKLFGSEGFCEESLLSLIIEQIKSVMTNNLNY